MLTLIVLLSSLVSILVMTLLNINNQNYQITLFLLVTITLILFKLVLNKMIKNNGTNSISKNVISNLKAKNAIVDEINNIMIASSSVVLSNKTKKLETEYLVWDEKKDKIYTENDVIITTEKEKIYAKGFSSDPNFNDYTLNKISGKMYISEID